MGSILVVEDSSEFQILIRSSLSEHQLQFCSTLAEARKFISRIGTDFQVVLLDVSLPDGDGIKFLTELKLQNKDTGFGVFVITSDTDVLTKIAAFGVGADDYICKPFHPLELRARVEAKLRQLQVHLESIPVLSIGDLILDSTKMSVSFRDGSKKIDAFTPIEFKILFNLGKRPEVVFSRNQLIDQLWGASTYVTDRTVDAHVSHVRKKIIDSSVKIKTVVGLGYKVVVEKTESP